MKRYYRKLQKFSESIYVSLPKTWTRKYQLEKASSVAINVRSDGCLIINPNINNSGLKEEKIILQANRTIAKDIARHALMGVDRIIILSDKIIENRILEDIRMFVDALPNTEVIEETPQRLEIQNFNLENIPTLKLIKRLLFLIDDMFDSVRFDKTNELEKNFSQLRKFYYIIVTHIRSYLRTGVYVSQDSEFNPLKAMDFRIICQKVEKIGERLLNLKIDKKITDYFNKINKYFKEITDAFLTNNFENAYDLMFKRDILLKEANELIKGLDYKDIDRIKELSMIAHNCRDIAALI